MQLPFVQDVARYCLSLGFWGFCGIDVLFDVKGHGHLVDLNPRVTGTCPALMVAHRLYQQYGFEYCLFRRKTKVHYRGSASQLLDEVDAYNTLHEGSSRIVLAAICELDVEQREKDDHDERGVKNRCAQRTRVNIGVYSANSLEECHSVLDHFTHPDDEVAVAVV
jgi:hypothetical protein